MKVGILFFTALLFAGFCNAQLQVTDESNAVALAQRLVGDGVIISNVSFTGNSLMAGYFKNPGQTNINIDSGIVLTSGRAKTVGSSIGLDGNGSSSASAQLANQQWEIPGDITLANAIGANVNNMNDACVLEFDFIPSGDTVKFNYIFSSEEYEPAFACSQFIDAFGFFISGPGISGQRNIALVPGTNLPVSILNINNAPDFNNAPPQCPENPSYYLDNAANAYFNHDGHTTLLTAISAVVPCSVYHLKLVISDNNDAGWDSGVFLESKSLTSNIVTLTNNTQTDNLNNSYVVEGCVTGSFTIKRPTAPNYPFSVNLVYGGTAVNGIDMQTLPAIVTIPANDSVVTVNVVPIIDNVPEGIEFIVVYAGSGCGSLAAIDSTVIQIRDYDTLTILPVNPLICKQSAIQLLASAAYSSFQWEATPGLNNYAVSNPVATPALSVTAYYCTANIGTCYGRDSVLIRWKDLEFTSQANVNCHDAATGQIIVSGGAEWASAPVQYSINNLPAQANGIFNNLAVGNYMVHITDGSGCKDSLPVNIIQSYPDLLITDTTLVAATCTSASDGSITVTVAGGRPPYQYSINGGTFQPANVFQVGANTFIITVKDANNCTAVLAGVTVPFVNGISLLTGADPVICESKSTMLPATTNASGIRWSAEIPAQTITLNNPLLLNPTANPVVTTKYYIVATLGVCTLRDSVTVIVNPAPTANAGEPVTVCYGGRTQLNASGGLLYQWHPATYLSNAAISNPIVNEATTITYFVDVTDMNGCKSLASDDIQVKVLPPGKLFAGYDSSVAINQPLQLLATDINNIGFIQYSWSPEKGLSNPFIKNPVATLTDQFNQLIVTARTQDNCIGRDTVKVNTYRGPEIYVANSFTPNGDGRNDLLKAFPVGIKSFSYFNLYNRFGQLVFSTTNENVGWDGKVMGIAQNMSTFVWIARAVDYKGNIIDRKGTTTIIR